MDVVALERKISRIEGVEAARVVAGNGHVDEVHVLARRSKSPKQLVRDVQSLGHAMFDTTIDRRVISVVQLSDADLEGGIRPILVDVSENTDGSVAEITVTLRWQESLLIGKSSGASALSMRPRQVAEATIEAVKQVVSATVAMAITSMDVPVLGSRKVAVAQVVLVTDNTEKEFIGAALVEDEEAKAVVKAVLDALNRQLSELKDP